MPSTFTFEEAQAPSDFTFEEAVLPGRGPEESPERAAKRAALKREGESARVGGRMQDLEAKASEAASRVVYTVSQMRPDLVLKRLVGLPFEIDRAMGLVPKDAVNPVEQPLLSPEHVENIQNSLRNLSKGESPWAQTTEAQPGPVEAGVNDFENQTVSGMTTPDAVLALAMGAKVPGAGVPVARTFQAQMIANTPEAIQNYLEARKSGDTRKTVAAALTVAASAGLPMAIEAGLSRGAKAGKAPQEGTESTASGVQTFGRDLETPSGAQPPEQFSFEEASKPIVPETPAEPYETVLETIRKADARTVKQIQQLFPKSELNREQARAFRDLAWQGEPSPASEAEPTVTAEPTAAAEELTAAEASKETAPSKGPTVEALAQAAMRVATPAEKSLRMERSDAGTGRNPAARAEAERPWDLIDEVEGNVGGLSLESAKQLDPDWTPRGAVRKLFGAGGQGIDQAAEAIRHSRVAKLSKDEDLLYALNAAADARKLWRRDFYKGEQVAKEQAKGQERFEKDAAKFKRPHDAIVADELMPGDEFELQGEKVKVKSLEFDEHGEVSHVLLEDGKKYGTVQVPGGTVIRMDEKTLQKAEVGPAWNPEGKVFSMSAGASRTLPKATPAGPPPVPAGPRAVMLPAAPTGGGAVAPPKPATGAWNFFTRARQAVQSVFSPQNIDPTAKRFANIIRHYNGQAALDLVRADAHLGELRSYFDKTPVAKDYVYDPNQPLPHNFAVIDAMERDRTRLPAELQAWAKTMDDEFAWRIAEVKKLKPGAMQSLIQNYFPHMWQDPKSGAVQSLVSEAAARSPLHGSKAFLNQRSLPLTVDGLARGLRPISDNPVDLALAKLHQMDKFIMASKVMQESKQTGMLKYYPLGRKIPAGRTVVDDPAFTVYAPPFLEVPEAFDVGIRKGLMDFIGKMGFRHERVAKLGVNEWGQYQQGGQIKSKFGGPDFVIMHEIGHGLQERYDFLRYLTSNSTLKAEMTALADLRGKGVSASRKFRKYIQTPDEQVANAVHAYLYAPDEMARVGPTVQKVIYNLTRQFPELGDLNDIKPGLALGSSRMNLPLAGPVLAGRWTLPDGAAAVLTNFLSPGLGRFMAFRTLRTASNILNGAQLGLSAFHVGFTSLDAVVSSVATSLAYGLRGDLLRAGKSAAFAPFAPVANYYVGKAVQRAMVEPPAAGARLRVPILEFPRLGIKGFSADLSPAGTDVVRNIAELAVQGGLRATVDPFWKTEVTRNLVRVFHEGGVQGYAKAGLRVPFAIVEQAMRPIAEFLVPRQKLGVFAQLALQEMHKMGWGAAVDDVRAGMARAADATEDRMGQMTYDNLFYNKAVKDVALLGFRAYGWQLGKYRHLYGAVSDVAKLVTGNGGVTNRMLYPVALTMVAATAGAIVHRLLTGNNPQTLQDYLLPQNGQVGQDGRPQRLMMPTYLKDLQSDWRDFPNYQKMGASFYHKLNPWVAETVDMWRNQDYYGVEIRHPDDPWAKQMGELAAYAGKQFVPFSIAGTMKLAEARSPTAQLVLPFFGIVPAKKALTMTPAETLASDIVRASLPVGARTQEQADHSEMLRTIVRDMKSGIPGAVDASKLRPGDEQTIIGRLQYSPLQYQVHKMPPADAMRVWRLANAQERQMLQQQIALKLAQSKTLEPELRAAMLRELLNPTR